MDPAMSATGCFVYGLFHHEPLGFQVGFQTKPVALNNPADLPYFAAQSSAQRLLVRRESPELLLRAPSGRVLRCCFSVYLLFALVGPAC
jgi:hypothetical protein